MSFHHHHHHHRHHRHNRVCHDSCSINTAVSSLSPSIKSMIDYVIIIIIIIVIIIIVLSSSKPPSSHRCFHNHQSNHGYVIHNSHSRLSARLEERVKECGCDDDDGGDNDYYDDDDDDDDDDVYYYDDDGDN